MIDKLSTALAKEDKYANISPETLELMGKQAANVYMDKGVSLNESISKLAAAHDDISQEQIKRVCEFANTAVYLAKHDQSKTAGASSSYPEFDLADPNRVIQELSDGTKSTITTKVDSDYSKMPEKKEKTSSARSTVEDAFEALFVNKTAEDLEYSKDTAINEVMAAKDQLNGLGSHLRSSGEQFDLMFKEASEEFYELSKRHMMDGGSFADIVKAAQATGASVEDVNQVLSPVIKNLVREKVASAKTLSDHVQDFSKVAHRNINPEHPMVKAAGAIISADGEMEKVALGLLQIGNEMKRVNDFIKTNLHG